MHVNVATIFQAESALFTVACGNAAKRQRFGTKLRGKSIPKHSFTTEISRILIGKYGLPKTQNSTKKKGMLCQKILDFHRFRADNRTAAEPHVYVRVCTASAVRW